MFLGGNIGCFQGAIECVFREQYMFFQGVFFEGNRGVLGGYTAKTTLSVEQKLLS